MKEGKEKERGEAEEYQEEAKTKVSVNKPGNDLNLYKLGICKQTGFLKEVSQISQKNLNF